MSMNKKVIGVAVIGAALVGGVFTVSQAKYIDQELYGPQKMVLKMRHGEPVYILKHLWNELRNIRSPSSNWY